MQLFFYDEQIRRYLLQFTRMFSLFEVEYGRNEQGTTDLIRVPIRYGDASRQAQTILNQNSANSLNATPMMTFHITGLTYDRERMQEPYHVNKMMVRQRTWDPGTESYETTQGNAFQVERLMPVPYKLTIDLDIWTSNTNQKMQLFEQIATLFNPALEIQATDNYIDWTSLTVCNLDNVKWSSKTIPVATNVNEPLDIMTMTFSMPIWISSPAKIKKLGVVERVIASIFDAQGDAVNAITNNDLLLGTRVKVTPWGYQVLLLDGQLQVLQPPQPVNPNRLSLDPFGFPIVENPQITWPTVINAYGVLPGISYITLDNPWAPDSSIIGTIAVNPADDRLLIYNIDPDTAPQNTLAPVDAVINPLTSSPGNGLDPAAVGQRYLLNESTGSADNPSNPLAWQGTGAQPLIAHANDIIEYNGTRWVVAFNSQDSTDAQYVINLTTGIQYYWNSTDSNRWVKSIDGLYPGGTWNLVL
jgi:T4-like virus Myoviridae tail sheath stabiliser